MLVSSIGYLNRYSNILKDSSVKNQTTKNQVHAGFGQVQNNDEKTPESIIKPFTNYFNNIFSSEQNTEKISFDAIV